MKRRKEKTQNMEIDEQPSFAQILSALRNQKKENTYLQKQLMSERYTYDKIIADLMSDIHHRSKQIVSLSNDKTKFKNIILRCKEMKEPIETIKAELTKHSKYIDNDFDALWNKLKICINHLHENRKERNSKIANLEQTILELNDLCFKQNKLIEKLRSDIIFAHFVVKRSRNDFNDLKREWEINSEKFEKDNFEMMQYIMNNINQIQNPLKLSNNVLLKQNEQIMTELEEQQLKIKVMKNKHIESEKELKKLKQDEIDWKNKYKTDVSFLNNIVAKKEIEIKQLKETNKSENIESIHELKYKIERLTERCQFIKVKPESINAFKQLAVKLKIFNNQIYDIGTKIRSKSKPKSKSTSPKSSISSLSSLRRNSLHLPNHLQVVPSQRATKLFNQLKQIFYDENILKRDSFEIIQLIRNEGSVMSPKEYNQPIDDLGNTFLHKSIQIAAVDIAKELLLHEADPNIQNIYQQSVLHLLCHKLHLHRKFMDLFISLIHSNKTNLRLVNNENKTCLEMIQHSIQQRQVINILQDATNNGNIQFGIKQLRNIIEKS